MAAHRSTVLVSPAELHPRIADSAVVLLDVRWALGRDDGHDDYLRSHLPGAVFVDLDRELAAPASPERGRHPLPDVDALQASARRWGIDDGDEVVVYDAGPSTSAARAWWLLRWAGVTKVRILDGGLAEWERLGLDVEPGEVIATPGSVSLRAGGLHTVDADDAAQAGHARTLLDARAPERYRGDVEPIDPRAGHIPGAVNLPTTALLDSAGRFLPDDALAEVIARHVPESDSGAGSFAVYCGSGVTATHVIAGLAVAGIDAALYPGSWSQWSNDTRRPAATGA
jgi:thiosulfate/3-mercaptopyruvate sulfurtransferase